MAYRILGTLLGWMEELRPAFTQPGFENALVVFVGWVLTEGTHAVTQALVNTDVARRRHHEAFHRFFSRGTWKPDEVGRLLFAHVLQRLDRGQVVRLVVDDTLAAKKGPEVFGIGSHLDAVRSTKKFRVFCFGHVWVVLSVLVRVPFSARPWALPVLFRLYRNKKTCETGQYRKKTELAREMVDVVCRWLPQGRIEVASDSAYCNDTVFRGLPERVVWFGAMRPDAVLTDKPPKRKRSSGGRPRLRGKVLPKPEALARNSRRPWKKCKAELYGQRRTICYKTIDAQWYRACRNRWLRIVVVRCADGALRVFFCTDPTLNVEQILEGYAERWATEVLFRDLKQSLGFGDSCARTKNAVERTAPFVGYIYTTLVLWFVDDVWNSPFAAPPIRPWYRHKRGLCFADVLRAAQRILAPLDVLDPARSLDDLRETDALPAERGKCAA